MKVKNKAIHIFSDTNYVGYQHINQMLFRGFFSKNKNVKFYHRFYMNLPKNYMVFKLIGKIRLGRKGADVDENPRGVQRIFNLPSTKTIFDALNSCLVRNQISKDRDTCITFLPSLSLSSVFSEYKHLIYYCVHDSMKQSYPRFNFYYEKELVRNSNLVFCDNVNVIKRLSGGKYANLLDYINDDFECKFFLVPPPVPSEFYDIKLSSNPQFDLCYFGSIHKDIDLEFIKSCLSLGKKINIISNERLNFKNDFLTYTDAFNDLDKLVDQISKSKALILPYLNSDFMETITPAKIYQCLALNLPIICSNEKLCSDFDLNNFSDLVSDKLYFSSKSTSSDCYSEDKILDAINEIIYNLD